MKINSSTLKHISMAHAIEIAKLATEKVNHSYRAEDIDYQVGQLNNGREVVVSVHAFPKFIVSIGTDGISLRQHHRHPQYNGMPQELYVANQFKITAHLMKLGYIFTTEKPEQVEQKEVKPRFIQNTGPVVTPAGTLRNHDTSTMM